MADATYLRATQAFRHGPTMVNVGDVFEAGDRICSGDRARFFEPVEARVRTTATVPGDVVSPPPAKKAVAKKAVAKKAGAKKAPAKKAAPKLAASAGGDEDPF